MSNENKKKKETLAYDENGGCMFMKNWSPTLRWICILPAVLIAFIVVKILFLGSVLNMLEKESYLLSLYIGAITSGLVYFAMVDVAAATAPSKRISTSIITAAILGLFLIFITVFCYYGILNEDYIPNKTHLIIALGIASLSNVLGLFMGISTTKDRQKKALKTLSVDTHQSLIQ